MASGNHQSLGGDDRIIQIQESAVGSAIVSGDGNTIYVIHQTTQQRQEITTEATAQLGPTWPPTPTRGWRRLQSRMATATFAEKPRWNGSGNGFNR